MRARKEFIAERASPEFEDGSLAKREVEVRRHDRDAARLKMLRDGRFEPSRGRRIERNGRLVEKPDRARRAASRRARPSLRALPLRKMRRPVFREIEKAESVERVLGRLRIVRRRHNSAARSSTFSMTDSLGFIPFAWPI